MKNILSFSKKSIPYVLAASLFMPTSWAQAEDVTSVGSSQYSSTLNMSKIAGYSTGVTDEEGGVAEIVKYNPHNKKFM